MYISSRFATNRAARLAGNGVDPMTDEQIRAISPSVFATTPHESRSTRFAHIPTFEVLAGMRREGFVPVKVSQNKSRIEGKSEFTKHMIRFRHLSHAGRGSLVLNQTFPEVVLINAHDGTSAYHLFKGMFRLACLNGMVVASPGQDDELHIPHKGDVVGKVIEGSFEVIDESQRAIQAAEAWTGMTLSRDEQSVMAEAAHMIRFGDAEGNISTPIQPEQMLRSNRTADSGNDLWRTFNRVQENAIRGGLTAMGTDANGQHRRSTSRAINGIDQDVKINRALWMIAERMAALKAA